MCFGRIVYNVPGFMMWGDLWSLLSVRGPKLNAAAVRMNNEGFYNILECNAMQLSYQHERPGPLKRSCQSKIHFDPFASHPRSPSAAALRSLPRRNVCV